MRFKLFEEFINEDKDAHGNERAPRDLALITLRYLMRIDEPLEQRLWLSQEDREAIKKEYGKRLPNGFPGPEKWAMSGYIIGPAVGIEHNPYFDGITIVFDGPWTKDRDFNCKVVDRKIASTWKELGEWLKKNKSTPDNMLDLWLDSDLSLEEFREKHRGRITSRKFGM